MAQRRGDQSPRCRLRAASALSCLDQGDLGADERAVGDVVVTQGRRCGVTGVLAVLGEEERRGLRGTRLLQVHGEEGRVVETVDGAKAVVEFQTVQDAGAVVETEDVLGEQVAMAVDHPPLPNTRVEQFLAAGEIATHQALGLLHPVEQLAVLGQSPDLREARFPARGQRVPPALLVDVRAAERVRVTGGKEACDRPQGFVDVGALTHEQGQAAFRRHAAHHHERFGRVRVRSAKFTQAQVDIRGEATVEGDFSFAHGPPGRRGRVVEEPQVDRLLQLVGTVTDEEQDRGVRLAHLCAR